MDALARVVNGSGAPLRWDDYAPGVRRFQTQDPVGNLLEFQEANGQESP
jgi:hypothetical protein